MSSSNLRKSMGKIIERWSIVSLTRPPRRSPGGRLGRRPFLRRQPFPTPSPPGRCRSSTAEMAESKEGGGWDFSPPSLSLSLSPGGAPVHSCRQPVPCASVRGSGAPRPDLRWGGRQVLGGVHGGSAGDGVAARLQATRAAPRRRQPACARTPAALPGQQPARASPPAPVRGWRMLFPATGSGPLCARSTCAGAADGPFGGSGSTAVLAPQGLAVAVAVARTAYDSGGW